MGADPGHLLPMRELGRPSWLLSLDMPVALLVALYVRDALGVPDPSAVLSEAVRRHLSALADGGE